jgi:hypothetical protein
MSREQAVQECNADARGWPQTTYGHQEFDRYRACMTARPYGMTRRTANVGSRPPRRPLFFHPGFATKLSLRLEPNCGATIIELSLPLSRQAVAALIPSILG